MAGTNLDPHPLDDAVLRIQLLGGFRVTAGDTLLRDDAWRLRKSSAIVKLLALAPDHRLLRDQVYDALWPDVTTAAARNNLNFAVHAARRALGVPRWLTNDGKLLSLPENVTVDSACFTRAAERAQLGDDRDSYLAAIQLYTGELLPEDRYEDWAAGPRERLRDLFVSLVLRCATLERSAGDLARAAALLERGLIAHPTHEELHVALMRAYVALGRRPQALRQFEQLRDVLRRELDCDPDPATIRLYESIQHSDLSGDGLDASGADARRRNAAYYLRLAQDLAPRTLGPDGDAVLDRLEAEHDHFTSALTWAVEEGEAAWGMLLAAELVALWNTRGHLDEGRTWLAKLLALPEPSAEQQTRAYLLARAHGLSAAAGMARIQGDTTIARQHQVAAQDIRARLGDRRGVAESMVALGFIDLALHDLPRARAELEEALAILREGDEPRMVAVALLALARVARQESRLNEAEDLATQSLAAYQRHGDRMGSTGALTLLGELASQRGDSQRAAVLHQRCLTLGRKLRYRRATALSQMHLGTIALRAGDLPRARTRLKDSLALLRELGLKQDAATCLEHLNAIPLSAS